MWLKLKRRSSPTPAVLGMHKYVSTKMKERCLCACSGQPVSDSIRGETNIRIPTLVTILLFLRLTQTLVSLLILNHTISRTSQNCPLELNLRESTEHPRSNSYMIHSRHRSKCFGESECNGSHTSYMIHVDDKSSALQPGT